MENAAEGLIEQSNHESGLIWSRYNAMLVAQAVFLGFTGALLVADKTPRIVGMGALVASMLGMLLCVLWWGVTAYAWSLAMQWFNASGSEETSPIRGQYKLWRTKRWGRSMDPIWWSAHLTILAFAAAYTLVIAYAETLLGAPAWAPIVSSLAFGGGWCALTRLTVRKLDISAGPKVAKEAPAEGASKPA